LIDEFAIEIDEQRSTDIWEKMFDPEENYSLKITSKYLELKGITNNTIIQIDVKYIKIVFVLCLITPK
jgi:hypothetical protein